MLKDTLYYSKILLFGEYGIIEDAMGLSIPYHFYKGKLLFTGNGSKDDIAESNGQLREYFEYLKSNQQNGSLFCALDLKRLEADIDKGLYFDSSIPQGFGVGSSGALVAAIYDAYAQNKIDEQDITDNDSLLNLKQALAAMESYFHGKSSGLDPLICYLNLPVLIHSKTELNTVGLPTPNAQGKGAIFLMDSGSPGQTQNMVAIFLEKCKQEGFRQLIKQQFKKYNDECIEAFLKKDFKPLFKSVKQLSQFALDNFSPMIPDNYKQLWKEGIESNSYYLKLCGSGGGGYILGFTEDYQKASELLKQQKLQVIYQF
jgi:mevalonate kinase